MEEDQQPYFERMLEHFGVSGALGYPFLVDFPSIMWIQKPLEAAGDELDNTLAQNVVLSISNQEAALAEALTNFKKEKAAFEDELEFVKHFIDKNEEIVRLNVLGSPVDVSRTVIRMHEESMLATIFDSSKWQSQPQTLEKTGRYLLVSEDGKIGDL